MRGDQREDSAKQWSDRAGFVYEATNKERLIFAPPSVVERFAWSLKTESMDDLIKKKRVRGGHRASASKLVAKIVEAIPVQRRQRRWWTTWQKKDSELERMLLQLDDALGKLGGQSLPLLTPTNLTSAKGNLDQSHVSISSAGKIIRAKLPKLRLRNFGRKICD